MLVIALIVLCCSAQLVELKRFIEVGNRNGFPIWIQTLTNNNGPALTNGIAKINPNEKKRFDVSDSGWAGRLWPKTGCDQNGANCAFGQSIAPCPQGGCQPPADTKVEFFFPPINSRDVAFYDISLVSSSFSLNLEHFLLSKFVNQTFFSGWRFFSGQRNHSIQRCKWFLQSKTPFQ